MIDKELKKVTGSVLAIGLNEKQADILNNNNEVLECFLLNANTQTEDSGTKMHNRIINIKKIRKIFKRKKFDYIICNFKEIRPYLRSFIKNSIYLNNKIIYFYNIKNFEIEELERRYIRYNADFNYKTKLATIDNTHSKTNLFKNIYFSLTDMIYDAIDYVGNLFVN